MMRTRIPVSHIEARACRALWAAVLTNVLRDLCGCGTAKGTNTQNTRAAARAAAEAWVGSFPRRDFRLVCDLAGLEPAAVHDRLRALTRLPLEDRQDRLGLLTLAVAGSNPSNPGPGRRGPATGSVLRPAMRRARVKAMLDAGVAPSQMPEHFAAAGQAVPIATVWNDLRHLRQSGEIGSARRANSPQSVMTQDREGCHG